MESFEAVAYFGLNYSTASKGSVVTELMYGVYSSSILLRIDSLAGDNVQALVTRQVKGCAARVGLTVGQKPQEPI